MQATSGDERREDHGVAEVGSDGRHGGVIHPGREPQPLRDPQHVVDDVTMLDGDPFRPARRAARVDHVREVLRLGPGPLEDLPAGRCPVEGVQVHKLHGVPRQVGQSAGLGERDRCGGIGEHEGDPLRRILRIYGHIRGARLENPQYSHHHVERALDEQPDGHLRPHAVAPQVARQAVGAAVQLAIAETLALIRNCRQIGRALRLSRDQLVQEGGHRAHAISSFMISFVPA